MIQEKHAYDDYGTHYPNSRKVYVAGSRPDIRVPFREIKLHGDNETSACRFARSSCMATMKTCGSTM